MIKRVIGLFIIFSVVSCSVFGSFVDMPENETDRNALLRAVENELLNGVSENEIAPYAPITRSQMGAILVRAMGASKESDISDFKDVSSNAWYYKELSRAVAMVHLRVTAEVIFIPIKILHIRRHFSYCQESSI